MTALVRRLPVVVDGVAFERPRVRGDCLAGGHNAARPCPWASCAYHLAVDVNEKTGHVAVHGEPESMTETCALDVAGRTREAPGFEVHRGAMTGIEGAHTLTEIAALVNVTRERIRQIEARALDELRFHVRAVDWK
jgi:hypothetical protein